MKVYGNSICAALVLICSGSVIASAQSLNEGIAAGIAREGLAQADAAIDRVPDALSDGLQLAREGIVFHTPEFCLGNVQNVINMGAIVSDMMPFSTVSIYEDSRGPVGRLRVMINGQKIHAEVYCEDNTLKAVELPWGVGNDTPREFSRGSLGAILGMGLNLKLQGAFDNETKAVHGASSPEGSSEAIGPADQTETLTPSLDTLANSNVASPPMTGAERDAFIKSVVRCWNIDPGSAAASVVLVVGVEFERSGRVKGDVTLLSARGGDAAAQATAFQAARRAVLRCNSVGIDLPPEKFEQWRNVEITFDPSGPRLR